MPGRPYSTMLLTIRRSGVLAALGLLLALSVREGRADDRVTSGTLEFKFPHRLTAGDTESAWRLEWFAWRQYRNLDPKMIRLNRVEFSPTGKAADYVTLFDEVRLAEARVLYDNHCNFSGDLSMAEEAMTIDLSLIPSERQAEYLEDVDGQPLKIGVREWRRGDIQWADSSPRPSSIDPFRIGEYASVWFIVQAGTYAIVVEYQFHDNGILILRTGSTGHNQYNRAAPGTPPHTHIHQALWRLLPARFGAASSEVRVLSRESKGGACESLVTTVPAAEGAYNLAADRFQRISLSLADPKAPGAAYDLLPMREGALRLNHPDAAFSSHDFWLTVHHDAGNPLNDPLEDNPYKLPSYVSPAESLAGASPVIWLNTQIYHIPRSEDFGLYVNADGSHGGTGNKQGGTAGTMWSSLTLRPRNLWNTSPYYPD